MPANTQPLVLALDLPSVAAAVSLSETAIKALVRRQEFPAPRQLSGRRVAWLRSEVEDWLTSRPVSDLPPPANAGRRSGDDA